MSLPWNWPPVLAPSLTSDNVANESDVPGANVTEALNNLQTEISSISFSADIVPLARWRASDAVLVGGQVQSITDTGTMLKDFVAIDPTRRVGYGTDTGGRPYLDFGPAAVSCLSAGVAADWQFLNDDSSVYSISIIGAITAIPPANSADLILNTSGYASANRGIWWCLCQDGTGAPGIGFEVGVLDNGQYNARYSVRQRNVNMLATAPDYHPRVWTMNYYRISATNQGIAGFTGSPSGNTAPSADLWQGRHLMVEASAQGMRSVNQLPPTNPMTLGGGRIGAIGVDVPLQNARIYEVAIYPRTITGSVQASLAQYAADTYGALIDSN